MKSSPLIVWLNSLKSKILSLASLVTSKILNEKVEITEVDEDALNIYLD